jgi:hypothetical protein
LFLPPTVKGDRSCKDKPCDTKHDCDQCCSNECYHLVWSTKKRSCVFHPCLLSLVSNICTTIAKIGNTSRKNPVINSAITSSTDFTTGLIGSRSDQMFWPNSLNMLRTKHDSACGCKDPSYTDDIVFIDQSFVRL